MGVEKSAMMHDDPQREDMVTRALFQGMFMQSACSTTESGHYLLFSSGREAVIHRSSSVRSTPQLIIYSDYFKTKSETLRLVSRVSRSWFLETASDYFLSIETQNEEIKMAIESLR